MNINFKKMNKYGAAIATGVTAGIGCMIGCVVLSSMIAEKLDDCKILPFAGKVQSYSDAMCDRFDENKYEVKTHEIKKIKFFINGKKKARSTLIKDHAAATLAVTMVAIPALCMISSVQLIKTTSSLKHVLFDSTIATICGFGMWGAWRGSRPIVIDARVSRRLYKELY